MIHLIYTLSRYREDLKTVEIKDLTNPFSGTVEPLYLKLETKHVSYFNIVITTGKAPIGRFFTSSGEEISQKHWTKAMAECYNSIIAENTPVAKKLTKYTTYGKIWTAIVLPILLYLIFGIGHQVLIQKPKIEQAIQTLSKTPSIGDKYFVAMLDQQYPATGEFFSTHTWVIIRNIHHDSHTIEVQLSSETPTYYKDSKDVNSTDFTGETYLMTFPQQTQVNGQFEFKGIHHPVTLILTLTKDLNKVYLPAN